jgi:predicted dithiol-disulfide oxidoreductase (DUF899 family)
MNDVVEKSTVTASDELKNHKVVSEEEWIAASKELLIKEKEFTRMRDQVSRLRRELPWVKVTKNYEFDGPKGMETLADLFDGRSQLIIYHFMLGPEDKAGCPGCSFLADNIDGTLVHLAHRDVTLVVVSRAPLPQIEAYKKRMGWHFKWVSSNGSDFNYDYHVSFNKEMKNSSYNFAEIAPTNGESPGTSVFYKDENGNVFHTYSSYARGGEMQLTTYSYLDLVPKGRDENSPQTMNWLRRHDEYGDSYYDDLMKPAPKGGECCH